MSTRLLLALVSVAALAVACGSGEGGPEDPTTTAPAPARPLDPANQPPGAQDPSIAEKLAEKPWEVISNKGETYLPNVFYADASENEQIMPWALDGHVQIDRLVYPTLGNPNLYTKTDPAEEFVSVLRVEDAAYAHLGVAKGSLPHAERAAATEISLPMFPELTDAQADEVIAAVKAVAAELG